MSGTVVVFVICINVLCDKKKKKKKKNGQGLADFRKVGYHKIDTQIFNCLCHKKFLINLVQVLLSFTNFTLSSSQSKQGNACPWEEFLKGKVKLVAHFESWNMLKQSIMFLLPFCHVFASVNHTGQKIYCEVSFKSYLCQS